MRRNLSVLIFICTWVVGSFLFGQSVPRDPRAMQFPDIEFKPIQPQSVLIGPGIRLYYKVNSELPYVSGAIIFQNGSLADPTGKTGLASLTMQLLKRGGTAVMSPEKLDERIDFLGSTISCYTSFETSGLNFWTLSKNFTETWKITTDMILNPGFAPERLELEKKKELEQIRRRWDQATNVWYYIFLSLLYGDDLPEVRLTTRKGIESITAEGIRDFYESQFKNREIIITLTGDFRINDTITMLKKSLKSWKGLAYSKPEIPPVAMIAKPGIYLVDKEDMTQAAICIGHLGVNRHDPDNVELAVLNFIFGSGGFSSRIMREIRYNRGLSYTAFGYLSQGRDRGTFSSFCQTKNQSAAEAIRVMINVIKDMTLNPVTQEELEIAKKSEQNSFVHRFDSSQAVITKAISLKIQGFPDDYLETYIPRIKKVDARKVLQMAQRTMKPDQLVILVVGKKAELLEQLKALDMGEVTEIPLPKENPNPPPNF